PKLLFLYKYLRQRPSNRVATKRRPPKSIFSPWCAEMTEMDFGLDSGFANPVLQSQATFRAIMDALANPGTPQNLTQPAAAHGALTPELASILLTLADQDTAIWLAGTTGLAPFVAFHTGAPITPEPRRAVFAFAGSAAELLPFDQFNLGTQEYPDRSTTIVLAVKSLRGGSALT